MTYGTLKFRLVKAFPGVDPDLIEGWIGDVYQQILSELPWSRTQVQGTLQTVAPYTTGTVALVLGSASVTLTTGTWTTGMTGRFFRVGTQDEFYGFTYVSASTGTLSRVYEGTTDATASYSIFKSVYALPADARLLEDDAFSSFELGPMERFSRAQLNASQPWRTTTGTPLAWTSFMDDASSPPRLQIELWPIPSEAIGLQFSYTAEGTALTATTQTIQIWLQPAALIEGTSAKIKRHLRDYAGAREHDQQAAAALKIMRGAEAHGMGSMQMQLSSYYTSHRSKRANR